MTSDADFVNGTRLVGHLDGNELVFQVMSLCLRYPAGSQDDTNRSANLGWRSPDLCRHRHGGLARPP